MPLNHDRQVAGSAHSTTLPSGGAGDTMFCVVLSDVVVSVPGWTQDPDYPDSVDPTSGVTMSVWHRTRVGSDSAVLVNKSPTGDDITLVWSGPSPLLDPTGTTHGGLISGTTTAGGPWSVNETFTKQMTTTVLVVRTYSVTSGGANDFLGPFWNTFPVENIGAFLNLDPAGTAITIDLSGVVDSGSTGYEVYVFEVGDPAPAAVAHWRIGRIGWPT